MSLSTYLIVCLRTGPSLIDLWLVMKRMNAGVFPACAVTLATKRPLAEEEILLQSGTIETIKRHMCLPDANDQFLETCPETTFDFKLM
jgi:hypothetical protein